MKWYVGKNRSQPTNDIGKFPLALMVQCDTELVVKALCYRRQALTETPLLLR